MISPEFLVEPGSIFIQIGKWEGKKPHGPKDGGNLFALLLEPTGNPDEFRRRGLAVVPEENRNAEEPDLNGMARKGWQKRIVMIV
jgi:hypothetical protein